MKKKDNELGFVGHLDELRGRLVKIVIAVIIAACIFYAFIDSVFIAIIQPVGKLVFTSPADAFIARLTLTIFGGLFLALPVTLYQIWQFVAAGLRKEERRYIIFFAPFSFFLFLMGGLFAYYITVPVALRFLLSFSSDVIVPMITIKNYISFLGTLILAFGVVFELPLVLMFLTKIGIATPDFFANKRRYAIVLILIVSAIITPPDVITQLMLSGPLIVLYEIGIIASRFTYRK